MLYKFQHVIFILLNINQFLELVENTWNDEIITTSTQTESTNNVDININHSETAPITLGNAQRILNRLQQIWESAKPTTSGHNHIERDESKEQESYDYPNANEPFETISVNNSKIKDKINKSNHEQTLLDVDASNKIEINDTEIDVRTLNRMLANITESDYKSVKRIIDLMFRSNKPVRVASRIVGGIPVGIKQYPFLVQILYWTGRGNNWIQQCAGSLINEYYLVSAGHCFLRGEIQSPWMVLAMLGTKQRMHDGVIVSVKAIKRHPAFWINKVFAYNDLALVLLAEKMVFNDNIGPVSLPAQYESVPDQSQCDILGWGKTKTDGVPAAELQRAKVRVIKQQSCIDSYTWFSKITGKNAITKNNICAGDPIAGKTDSCQGDSGGPLLCRGKLVGVTSWGSECGSAQHPGVYTRIANFIDWIQNNSQV